MLKYSIIVPVYRVEEYLPACIDSVLNQTSDVSFELILVDDGSPDGSGRICDDYAAKDARIRVLHTENRGVSRARNYGVTHAAGEYLLFLDADDVWDKSLLASLEKITENTPDMAMFGFSRLTEDGSVIPGTLPLIPNGESGPKYLERLFASGKSPCTYSCCYAYNRKFFLANDLQYREDLKVSEDFDQIMRALGVAAAITSCEDPAYFYRIRQNSATSSVTAKKLTDNLTTKAEYFRKYSSAALANLYANNAILAFRVPKNEFSAVAGILRDNRDIWQHVSQFPLKCARILVFCFGDRCGSLLFGAVRKLRRLFHRS